GGRAVNGDASPGEPYTWWRWRWLGLAPESGWDLALACRTAGLREPGERLWAGTRSWQPAGADQLSLFLSAQIAYGASWEDCRRTSRQLLALRTGDRWEHTRATSWALAALAQLLAYLPERSGVRRVRVEVGGRVVLDLSDRDGLRPLVHRVHLPADRLPVREG